MIGVRLTNMTTIFYFVKDIKLSIEQFNVTLICIACLLAVYHISSLKP